MIRFSVPGTPPNLNSLIRDHWTKRRQAKAVWAQAVRISYLAKYGCSGLVTEQTTDPGRRRVSLDLQFKSRRRRDPDNFLKATLDALVSASLLSDDSADWVEIGSITFRVGDHVCTTITLQEADGG